MKKIIATIMVVMTMIGMIAPYKAIKAEAAYFDDDGHVRFTVADAVYSARWNQRHAANTNMYAVLTMYNHITVAMYNGKIVRVGVGDGTIDADVADSYIMDYFRLNDVEVLI